MQKDIKKLSKQVEKLKEDVEEANRRAEEANHRAERAERQLEEMRRVMKWVFVARGGYRWGLIILWFMVSGPRPLRRKSFVSSFTPSPSLLLRRRRRSGRSERPPPTCNIPLVLSLRSSSLIIRE